jgi:DNA-binding NarL/FixJ family response regulator
MLRVALLDDHPAVLTGLRRLIDQSATSPSLPSRRTAELVRELDDLQPDVLILDYELARGDGLAQCAHIKRRPYALRVIISPRTPAQRRPWRPAPPKRTDSSTSRHRFQRSCPRCDGSRTER